MRALLPALALLLLPAVAPAGLFTPASERVFRDISGAQERIAGLVRSEVVIDGLRLSVLDNGLAGAPQALLVVHGFGDRGTSWNQFTRRFRGGDFRILAPDLAGFGESDKPDGADYGAAAQARRLLALMDARGVAQAHVVGNSMGGLIAAELALLAPGRVASLVLVDAAGVHYRPSELDRRLMAGDNPLVVRRPEDFAALMAFVMASEPMVPKPYLDYLGEQAAANAALHERIFREALFPDANGLLLRLQDIRVPTLVVWGELDRVLHPDNGRAFCHFIPQCELRLMPATGHVPMVERPDDTANLVLDFIARRRAAAAQAGNP